MTFSDKKSGNLNFYVYPDVLGESRILQPASREFRRLESEPLEWGIGFLNSGLFAGLRASPGVRIQSSSTPQDNVVREKDPDLIRFGVFIVIQKSAAKSVHKSFTDTLDLMLRKTDI